MLNDVTDRAHANMLHILSMAWGIATPFTGFFLAESFGEPILAWSCLLAALIIWAIVYSLQTTKLKAAAFIASFSFFCILLYFFAGLLVCFGYCKTPGAHGIDGIDCFVWEHEIISQSFSCALGVGIACQAFNSWLEEEVLSYI